MCTLLHPWAQTECSLMSVLILIDVSPKTLKIQHKPSRASCQEPCSTIVFSCCNFRDHGLYLYCSSIPDLWFDRQPASWTMLFQQLVMFTSMRPNHQYYNCFVKCSARPNSHHVSVQGYSITKEFNFWISPKISICCCWPALYVLDDASSDSIRIVSKQMLTFITSRGSWSHQRPQAWNSVVQNQQHELLMAGMWCGCCLPIQVQRALLFTWEKPTP